MIIFPLLVFGLIFGSFVNAMVWRLHQQAELTGKDEKPTKATKQHVAPAKHVKAGKTGELSLDELSMLKGRSMCSRCHHPLATKDLIPLFSWLALRGKCRYCHQRIQDSPLVEVVTPLLFVLSYWWWPLPLHSAGAVQFGFWLAFLVGFMVLAVYDLRWYLLPNRVVFPLVALAAAQVLLLAVLRHHAGDVLSAIFGALVLSGIFWLLFTVSDGTWIGGGDVKLALVLGALAGTVPLALLVLFVASLVGTVVSIPLLMRGKQGLKLKVPFGPYLLFGTVAVVLFGQRIVDWYTGLLGVR